MNIKRYIITYKKKDSHRVWPRMFNDWYDAEDQALRMAEKFKYRGIKIRKATISYEPDKN